jgi:calcium-dependent protein kinase
MAAKLDRVTGIANQRIIGNYSVVEDYEKDKVCGDGLNGAVWKAKLLENPKWPAAQKDVVLKTMTKQALAERKWLELIAECEVGLLLDHPFICRLLRVYEAPKDITLVLEYCAGGDLFDRFAAAGKFSEKAAKLTCVQMLSAIKYLRAQNVVHRDIKLENWLYATDDPRSPVCLTDFGFATFYDPEGEKPLTEMMGSPYYVAPEVLKQSYGMECDIWSTGVIAFMLLSGIAPYSGESLEETFNNIINKQLEFHEGKFSGVSEEAKNFLSAILERDTKKRPSAAEALEHPWTRDLAERRFKMTAEVRAESMEMLLNLAKETTLRRAVMICIGGGAQTESYRDARRQFLDLDLTGSGTISKESFMELSKAYCKDGAEAEELFKKLDIHDHKELQYSQFLAAYMNLELVEDEDAILRAFRVFDADRDGFITVADLEKVLVSSRFGNDGARMLQEVGCEDPGGLDLNRFRAMVLSPSGATPARPGGPALISPKRVKLVDDSDIGGAGEGKRERSKVTRTPSMIHPELARSISLIRPPCKQSPSGGSGTDLAGSGATATGISNDPVSPKLSL